MYSWEISKILENNNYRIDSELYIDICKSSPQLSHIKYNSYDNCFEVWDDANNYWRFQVYLKKQEEK